MTPQRKPGTIAQGKNPKSSVSDSIRTKLEAKASALIEKVLKPKHIVPPTIDERFNYITNIAAKWHGKYFYFYATYTCPSPNANTPTFESNFARMEYVGADRFALSYMKHNDKWVTIYAALSIHECLKSVENDPWFRP